MLKFSAAGFAWLAIMLGFVPRVHSKANRKEDLSTAAKKKARALCSELTLDEKIALIHGTSGLYVGQNAGIPRLGIPPLTMNDGPQGFRVRGGGFGEPGTSTSWPCALAIAASWDPSVAARWGEAMAVEFLGKGANVMLGPGVNVIRIPRNGRNFEYLSGEDPMLGAPLIKAQIEAIQDLGIIANVKHFSQNNQEKDRMTVDEIVDEQTHWELYMPPFEAAVDAGVLSVMCSYNKVNGLYACENEKLLENNLKNSLGFKGFVVSDWGATHSTLQAANAGLDMEMPGGSFFNESFKEAIVQKQIPMSKLDEKVERIMYSMIVSGAIDRPTTGDIYANVTSTEHNSLARELATETIVLLKNQHKILPLNCNQKIKVIGDVIISGGGSGHVDPPYIISGFEGIRSKCLQSDVLYSPMEIIDAPAKCSALIEGCDVVVVFASTTSSEGSDRPSLSFPDDQIQAINHLIDCAADKLVIVGTVPGAILLPFAADVRGLILAFMPGQEAGNAVADILFGDVNPSGRLPMTLPNRENEMKMTPDQYPGIGKIANYSERLWTGYRWYDAQQVSPRFPFGFGLSYTQFVYSEIQVIHAARSVTFSLSNVGERDGSEICQLYLGFPSSAKEPPRLLKHYRKIFLKAGKSISVAFSILDRDLSVWDTVSHGWVLVAGTFDVWIGSSSADLHLHAQMEVTSDVLVSRG